MATAKKRINITVNDEFLEALKALQKLRQAPSLSAVVKDLAMEALELQEDLYFAQIVKERENEEVLSHEEVWK